jgi:hypothetical protein
MPDINSFFPSSFLRAADLPQPRVLTMTDVTSETFDDGTSKPCVGFQETQQRLGLNKTNANSIQQLYGSATESWSGKQIECYQDMTHFQGRSMQCVRVRAPGAFPTQAIAQSISNHVTQSTQERVSGQVQTQQPNQNEIPF